VRCLKRHGLRLVAAIVAVAALTGAAAISAQTTQARAGYTPYMYKAKVAIKGGTTLSNAYDGSTGYIGDVKSESSTSSFSIDGKMSSMLFYKGAVPKNVPRTLDSGSASVINGTWTDQGQKWVTYNAGPVYLRLHDRLDRPAGKHDPGGD
jgi:hypothetical protein